VEPDPAFIPSIAPYLTTQTKNFLHQPEVNIIHEDPRSFLRRSANKYDVVLMNMGDPITAQMNRFYTKNFFDQVKKRLTLGGIFSFAVSGGESMLGPAQARFLGSLRKTLMETFPNTLIYPGDQARFFATDISGTLFTEALSLWERKVDRKLQLAFITESYLEDALSPFRLDYLRSILTEIPGVNINRDFYPICYFHNLMMWATQWHPLLQNFLFAIAQIKLIRIWAALAVFGAVIIGLFLAGKNKYKYAVSGTILVSGIVEMVIQIVLVLAFQIIVGFVYRQLALIIGFFMAGLAVGSGFISRRHPFWSKKSFLHQRFLFIQALICIAPIGLALALPQILETVQTTFSPETIGGLFSIISLLIGFIGGIHFGVAVIVMDATGKSPEGIGGLFYALDLMGAALGALMASCFIIPIYGITNTLIFLSLMAGISFLTLLRTH
jgi:spermidine synthase